MVQQRSDGDPGDDSGGHTSACAGRGRDASDDGCVDVPDGNSAGRRGLRRLIRRRAGVELITDARQTPLDNLNARRRKYAILQGSRIPFLLASAVTWVWWENTWISAVLFAVSVPLPWIAVVIGNGAGEPRDPRVKQVYKPGVIRDLNARQMLRGGGSPELGDGRGDAPGPGGRVIEHD